MTYRVEGVNRVFWKLAKTERSESDLSFEGIKNKIYDFSYGSSYNPNIIAISDYEVFELVAYCVGNAIEAGLITTSAFVDAMKTFQMHPGFASLFPKDSRSTELKIVHSLLNMLRYVQVKNNNKVLVDFGQYEKKNSL